MENTVTKPGFRKKFLGDKAFYKMVLAIAIPIMIQNGITNFVSPVLEFLQLSTQARRIMKVCARHFATNYGW